MTETQHDVELYREQVTALAIVDGYTITNPDEALVVSNQLASINKLAKDIETARDAAVRPLNAAVNAERERWRPVQDLAARLKGTAQAVLGAWQVRERQRLALEHAAREAEAAKMRAVAEEASRLAREVAARRAEVLEARGKSEQAQAVLEAGEAKAVAKELEAALQAAALPATTEVKLAGTRTAETWEPTVVDLRKALLALAADEFVDLEALVDLKKSGLNALAKQYKDKLSAKYPGLKATMKLGVAPTGR